MVTRNQLLEGMRSFYASMVETNQSQLDKFVQEVLRAGDDPEESMALRVMAAMMREREERIAAEIRRLQAGGEIGQGTIAAEFLDAMERL